MTLLLATSASAGDTWADQLMAASNSAERDVSRRHVRVASLNDVATETVEQPQARTRRAATETTQPNRRIRVASLGGVQAETTASRPRRSLSGGSVNWTVDSSCLNGTLRGIVRALAADFGPITVNSTCRGPSHNRAVGGAPHSYHLHGDAVDFRAHSHVAAIYASLRTNGNVGGLKHYGGGLFHIDTGPRRSW